MAETTGTDNVESRLKELEAKAWKAEKWLWVVSLVAGIFTYTLADTWKELRAAQAQASEAKTAAASAVADLARAKEDAAKAIREESGAILESHRPAFAKWVDEARSQLDRWPSGAYAILRGKGNSCPAGFRQVDTFVHAIASFLPDSGDGSAYIKQAEFGASTIRCHGGANCSAYNRPPPTNINWLADLDLSLCVKEQ